MTKQAPSSNSAKILYRPLGLLASIAGGIAAGQVFKQVWRHATPGENTEAPKALDSQHRLLDILAAAAVQGAIFATVKALVNRGGARAFQRWTGEWPGE
jgi:Protein of unknown function (DUF4235)